MNTDIIARWRDAITDPPPDGWRGLIRNADEGRAVWFRDYRGKHYPGDQWLDVTDVPAVAASEIETLVTAAFIRRYPGGQPAPQEIPCHEARAPEPAEIEAQRTLLIEEMVDHGMHAEDAAQSVDGLIGVCQRGAVPLVKVQAAVKSDEWINGYNQGCSDAAAKQDSVARTEVIDAAKEIRMYCPEDETCCYKILLDHTGITPTEVTP